MRRLDVDEVDVHAIDLAHELRQRVQARLDPPEVVLVQPVTRERLQRLQLDTLRPVGDQLLARPTCRTDALVQVVELHFGNVDFEGADFGGRLSVGAHRVSFRRWEQSVPAEQNFALRGAVPGVLRVERHSFA